MNALDLAQEIETRYPRYLRTTFFFKDPALRQSFDKALRDGELSKGPYVEALPVFQPGRTPAQLFPELLGSCPPDKGFLNALWGGRRLYSHQEEAIRATHGGKNVVVATGTGSGKTEAFLYPILLHLYREFCAGRLNDGVRALILYPMNALANDQRERLGTISSRLAEAGSEFRFTFGQYTGETPEDKDDRRRRASECLDRRLSGELVLRTEMRSRPPHILLTNYSMLEFLLLRPNDSELFDNGRSEWWRFMVLDEAHQYRGARGIEMAMLLRRLKRRLHEGGASGHFCCIATSATLTGGDSDRPVAAKFASDLFDEPFEDKNVLTGNEIPIPEPSTYALGLADYQVLGMLPSGNESNDMSQLNGIATKLGLTLASEMSFERCVSAILMSDGRAARLRRRISGTPTPFADVASNVFPELPNKEQGAALVLLITLLLRTRTPDSEAPLASIRYHFFLRSLEGAFVSYLPSKRVRLDRETSLAGAASFEVALCRECGQHYFVAQKNFRGGKLGEASRDPGDSDFGATFLRPLDSDEGEANAGRVYSLCLRCGEARIGRLVCGHQESIQVVKELAPEDEDRADQIAKCGACGYAAAGRDPVRELVHGADGPHAVVATTLHQLLPQPKRKVLAFADGRQEAAFFAWYLEDSYRDILSRSRLLRVARSYERFPSDGLSLRELAGRALHDEREAFRASAADRELDIRKNIWRALYREFLSDEQRISLEGVGLVCWSFTIPPGFKVPAAMFGEPWLFSSDDARIVVSLLFEAARADRAVELRTDRDVTVNWNDLGLRGSQQRLRIGEPQGALNVVAWDGPRGRRVRMLAKYLSRQGLSAVDATNLSQELLRSIWEAMKESDRSLRGDERILVNPGGDVRVVNPDWWSLFRLSEQDFVSRCDTCGRIQFGPAGFVCPRPNCPGKIEQVSRGSLGENHYRSLYESELPADYRVEEHTAQLAHDKAREFQNDFRTGRIHLLSCSTTFELGVDLGDLDTVFLRNVPPESFNYTQRVGRAGRRVGSPGFAVTYCRRNAHDRYHFTRPERMLTGRSRPPVLSLTNEKIIARHMTALALSGFLRANRERFGSVEAFIHDWQHPAAVSNFREYLLANQAQIGEALKAVVPLEMVGQAGLRDERWIDLVASQTSSRLSQAEVEVAQDYQAVRDLKEQAATAEDYTLATWAKYRAETIASEDVITFLSRKAVIPKYGFPVDVVELDLQPSTRGQPESGVALQRDLSIAIAEFAPSSKLIANKREWTSYGLKRIPEREWKRWRYARCVKHNRFERRPYEAGDAAHFERCCDSMVEASYVEPRFGFTTKRDRPKEPRGRTGRVFTTRPYFAGSAGQPGDSIVLGAVSLVAASPGIMVTLCEGRRGERFYICGECGAGFTRWQRNHDTPKGTPCGHRLERPAVALGHSFVTDVLQMHFHPHADAGLDSIWFSYSLAYALLESAAEVLEVPPNDLNVTVASGAGDGSGVLPIVLYDNVPGGAGLVRRLESSSVFEECLKTTLERVGGKCGCAEDTSCYGCLRSFRNQFAHRYLQRGPVYRYVDSLVRDIRS